MLYYTKYDCEIYIVNLNDVESNYDFIHIKKTGSEGIKEFIENLNKNTNMLAMNNELFERIYEKIEKNLEHIIFEELSKYENVINCSDFYIKIYRRENTEDAQYISQNAQIILNFMRDGYASMSNSIENVFAGLQGRTDLRRKWVEAKIAYDKNDNIIAISLYNSFMTGKKCIGLTATTDTSLRELGKEAVKEIIRFDINNHKLFYWCECSGAIEHYFDKFHGFKIPNTYAASLYNNAGRASKIVSLSEDGYHFVRSLTVQNDEYEIEKIIYGFPSQEIFDEMMKTNKYSIDEQLKAIDNSPITEDYEYTHLSDIEKADMILDVFYGEVSDGYNNFSVYAMDILRKYTNLVHDAIKSNRHYSRYTRDDLQDIYDMGIQYLTLCSELKLYKC